MNRIYDLYFPKYNGHYYLVSIHHYSLFYFNFIFIKIFNLQIKLQPFRKFYIVFASNIDYPTFIQKSLEKYNKNKERR